MDRQRVRSSVTSIAIHTIVIAFLLFLAQQPLPKHIVSEQVRLVAPLLKPLANAGGGGERSTKPAGKGALPKPSPRQFTPPRVMLANLTPKLPMEPTLELPPDVTLPQVHADRYGDPLSHLLEASGGRGGPLGIGDGRGTGVGSSRGAGYGDGDPNGGVYRAGQGATLPVPIRKVEPEFSEEARKAKAQGTVIIYIEVGVDGKPRNLRVARGYGLGLDEKALEAVAQWLFRPGTRNGKPVVVSASVEVSFHLL